MWKEAFGERGRLEVEKQAGAVIAVVQESMVRAWVGGVGEGDDEQKWKDPGLLLKVESTELVW